MHINVFEVAQTSIKPAPNDCAAHIVTTLRNSHRYSRDCHLGIWQAEKNEPHSVAGIPPSRNHPCVNMSAQSRFKSKAFMFSNSSLNLRKHEAAGLNRRAIRFERRQPGCDEIHINKIRAMR